MARIRFVNGAPRSRLVVPFPTHMWGDIPAIRWRTPPRPKAVASCYREDPSGRKIVSFPYDPLLVAEVKAIEGGRWHPTEKHRSFQSCIHISTKSIGKIKSPLDNLNLKEGGD